MAKKIYAYGMDGFVTPMMKYFASEGCLPNFSRLLREGTVNETYPSFPVWTPTNWATLSTGAHTGTHSVPTWQTVIERKSGAGEKDVSVSSFDGRANNAERIWNSLERAGLKSVAVHYPGAHPSGVEIGYVVDGFGAPGHNSTEFEVAAAQAYTTDPSKASDVAMAHDGSAIQGPRSVEPIESLAAAEGWTNLPDSASTPLATTFSVNARLGGDANHFHLLAVDRTGSGYDRVLICRSLDAGEIVAEANLGGWSDWAIQDFLIDGQAQEAAVRFKLLELAPDGSSLKLYRTQVTYTNGFTYGDSELEAELIRRFGPYQEHASMTPYTSGMTDFDTALEECEYQGLWFAKVANYMLHERDCSYFTCHWHLYDYLNHIHLADADPACPGFNPDTKEKYLDYFRRTYQVGDRVLGLMYEAADRANQDGDEVYVGIISDHGAYPDVRIANLRQFLCDEGFLVLQQGGEDAIAKDLDPHSDEIDWDRTKAYLARRGFDITINADPGPKFDQIERELLTALRTWVDEETGNTVVAVALPKRDAYLLGQWGDECGDVIFAWDHDYVSGYYTQWLGIEGGGNVGAPLVYGAHHGGFIPTTNGFSSTFGSFFLDGPGLKKGYERPVDRLGYIHAVDVVPTFCHILGVDPPAQAQGTVVRDLYEGHEMVRERQK
ncbi:MAG: alkaline phosphatase family protein [Caldilineaceae bacterium]|nr:alkaline phosphatase family protein [Caldilineaceae bacterium]